MAASAFKGISVAGFSHVSAPLLCALFVAEFFLVLVAVHQPAPRKQKMGATWGCGSDLSPQMEITSTGSARSIITIFKGILKPSMQHETEYHDAESRYLPKSRMVTFSIKDLHLSYLYVVLHHLVSALSTRAKAIQSGNINAYILYIFVALLIALALVK